MYVKNLDLLNINKIYIKLKLMYILRIIQIKFLGESMNIFHLEKAHKAFTKATLAFLSVFLASDIISQDSTVEEVIVTAQKKSENLQNVPITVQNLSSEDIDDFMKEVTNVCMGGIKKMFENR